MSDAGLLFGVASGAMHVEGAVDADGRTPSVWDAVDGLLDRDIEPWVSLYRRDLPLELMLDGGWLLRNTAEQFGDYVGAVADRLGDRVAAWVTLDEPYPHMALGHAVGVDAPGLTLLGRAFPVTHHLLLGHARAVAALPLDFYGVAYEHPVVVAAALDNRSVPLTLPPMDGVPCTATDLPIHPPALERRLGGHPGMVRTGLVRVDPATLDRSPRASFRHYRDLIAASVG